MSEVLRRLRRTEGLRQLFAETRVSPKQLVYPIFIKEGLDGFEPIESMPGQARIGLNQLPDIIKRAEDAGIGGLLLFGLPISKSPLGDSARDTNGIIPLALQIIKATGTRLPITTDICLCGYTDHGHCGILKGESVDHERTRVLLAEIAVAHATAGADIVAPSSMVDGQVGAIRESLDQHNLKETAILGYSAKFASAFYGPFREAADSTPAFGDRRAYQHDPLNLRHARREILQDVAEGADAVMIKPGQPYLDVVRMAKETVDVPVAIYQVSGEYAMIRAAAERGWIDEKRVILESLAAFSRAGADLIITYFALEAAPWLT